MSLAEGSGVSSSPECEALGDVLELFGDVADFAARVQAGAGERIAAIAVAIAQTDGCDAMQTGALYYAARLRNAGALGNPAYRGDSGLNERDLRDARRQVPVDGARLCARIDGLPAGTADVVRWQAECWDGTGYPDGLRWHGIPREAQLLHLAVLYHAAADPEEGLAEIGREAGRLFGPERARAFMLWFHSAGGAAPPAAPPLEALRAGGTSADDALALLASAADEHAGAPGRAEQARFLAGGDKTAERAACIASLLSVSAPLARLQHSRTYAPALRRALEAQPA